MGQFSDLPRDVVWLILRRIIYNYPFGSKHNRKQLYARDYYFATIIERYFLSSLLQSLSMVSKSWRILLQSKCERERDLYRFVQGAFDK